jgi:multiple sugar transport system permease protein
MKPREFWPFVIPSVLVMTALMVFPLFFTLYLSFQNFTLGEPSRFVGLLNYVRTLGDERFWNALRFTLLYMVFTIPAQMFIGFVLALLLNEVVKLKRLLISGYLLPFIVTPVVGTLAVAWLFRDRGLYTYLLSQAGLNIQWYSDPIAAKALIILYGIWSTVPFALMMIYASLQAMPGEPIEAAIVDGATWLQRVRHVVVPYLRPIFFFIAMIGIMDSFRLFDSVAVMTKGGPGVATETVMFYTYGVAFTELLLGRGSSIVVLGVLIILLLLSPLLYRTYKDIMGDR